jgi:ribonucleoside-triphosphate reductase
MNLEQYTTQEGFEKLIDVAAQTGCNYFCFNVRITICNDCNHIDKKTKQSCEKCGSTNIDYATRVIGYLKRVNSFSKSRQNEHQLRHYHLNNTNSKIIKNNLNYEVQGL